MTQPGRQLWDPAVGGQTGPAKGEMLLTGPSGTRHGWKVDQREREQAEPRLGLRAPTSSARKTQVCEGRYGDQTGPEPVP